MENKLAVVKEMVMCGYALMNRTMESMANDFTLEQLEDMRDSFFRFLGLQ